MGMVHVTSGRSNFTYQDLINAKVDKTLFFERISHQRFFIEQAHTLPKSFIPKTLLKRMLIRENELRLSEEYQKLYADAERRSYSTWADVTDQLQREVIREFHLDEEMDEALLCLRCATQIYPDLKEIPLYVRYNRARDGDLQLNDVAPNVPVVQLDGKEGQLFDGLESSPTVLISGSYS